MLQSVAEWPRILRLSYTAWAFYILALLTIAPDAIFSLTGIDTNPLVWGWLQIGAVLFGLIGRIIEQNHQHRWLRRAVIAGLAVLVMMVAGPSLAMSERVPDEPAIAVEQSGDGPSWQATSFVLTPLVARWEGKRNTAYLDIVGVPTICYGHTRTITAEDVSAGVTWTDEQCEELLRDELFEYWEETRKGFTEATVTTRLTPERDAAYASLSFNVGWGGVRGSTATRRLNAGDILGGCEALTWYNKAGGMRVRGLVLRRTEERALCELGLKS